MDDEMNSKSVKQDSQTSKEDYVRQRQNFMQHMAEADEKIKNLQQELSRTQDELEHIKSTTTNNLNQQFEITKKQYDEEITSLQHRFNATVQEGRDEKVRLENELFKLTNRSPHLDTAMLEEIEMLKGQLKEARRKLATVPVASSNELIDLSSISAATNLNSDTDDASEVERNLKAEQCVRQDVEMHVITLNSHRMYLQQELEAVYQQLKTAQVELEREKTAHDNLKHTWDSANRLFLQQKEQLEKQMKLMQLSLKASVDATAAINQLPTPSTNDQESTIVDKVQLDRLHQSSTPILDHQKPHRHKRSMSDGIPTLPLELQDSVDTKGGSLTLQDVHPLLISTYNCACTGANSICKTCSMATCLVGRKPSQTEIRRLQEAIKHGDTSTIERMIRQDSIDVNANLMPFIKGVPKWGWGYLGGYKPIHYAVEEGKLSSVQVLVQLGANIMATATRVGGGKVTAAERAVDKNHVSMVHFFVKVCRLDKSKFHNSYQMKFSSMANEYGAALPKATSRTRNTPQVMLTITHQTLGKGRWGHFSEAIFKGQKVAAKFFNVPIMPANNRDNLFREINISARLHHKNLVKFMGVVLGHPVIMVFELMDCTLQLALIDGRVTVEHVHPICLDIAQGLLYLHTLQPNALIHHNINSSNVLIKAVGLGWSAKLTDLSLAQFTNTATQNSTLDTPHSIYTAPEVLQDSSHPHTTKIDVFSFGVLLMEALMRRLPTATIAELIATLRPHWPHHVTFLRQCTSDDPNSRPNISMVISTLSELCIKTAVAS